MENEPNTITFKTGGESDPIIKLCPNGDIFVKGKLVENDAVLVEGLREYLSYATNLRKAETLSMVRSRLILTLIAEYMDENPSIRFTQALFNLEVLEFADKGDPQAKGFLLRDVYNDHDQDVLSRVVDARAKKKTSKPYILP